MTRNSIGSVRDIKEDKQKQKKKKPGCFGFLVNNKNKKFVMDQEGHQTDLKMSDLKHLSSDIISQILASRKAETEKDSSSSSDEDDPVL